MQKRDYLEDQIQQIAAAIARMMGLHSAEQTEAFEEELDAAWRTLTGLRRSDLDRLTPGTVVALLRPKREATRMLLEAELKVRANGDARAETCRHLLDHM